MTLMNDIENLIELKDSNDVEKVASLYLEAESNVKQCEAYLKQAVSQFNTIKDSLIPQAMGENQSLVTKSGIKVTVKELTVASIQSVTALNKLKGEVRSEALAKKRDALKFILKTDPSIIKNNLTINLGKDSKDLADKIALTCSELEVDYKLEPGVHHSALNAWVTERGVNSFTVEQQDLLNIKVLKKATVKQK